MTRKKKRERERERENYCGFDKGKENELFTKLIICNSV